MIDLHSHILPGLDDGAADLSTSCAMARLYVEQGVTCVVCTPHILPGLYHNSGPQIRAAVNVLQHHLATEGIALRLLPGADNHIEQHFLAKLGDGQLLTIADSRYVLVEPPHHVMPARLDVLCFDLMLASYVPVLTHPERLTWIEEHYQHIEQLQERGVWMQITSGSLLGRFGRRARYWAERMLSEGRVHVLASDAHNAAHRPPDLFKGRAAAERLLGASLADRLVITHPMMVLANEAPEELKSNPGQEPRDQKRRSRNYADTSGSWTGPHLTRRLRELFVR